MKVLYATNRCVVGKVGQCSLLESSDSNGWSVCFGRDRSDPAAHAKHYKQLWKNRNLLKVYRN